MESSHLFTIAIIALIAAAMLFIEKRPPHQVGLAVAFMVMTWVAYLVVFREPPPAL